MSGKPSPSKSPAKTERVKRSLVTPAFAATSVKRPLPSLWKSWQGAFSVGDVSFPTYRSSSPSLS